MQALFLAMVLCYLSNFLADALEAEVYQSIILPCSFLPGEDVVIHWTAADNEKQLVVHKYYHGKDILSEQDKSYKQRTSLFLHEIKNGNASLRLLNLQKSDEKMYSCYVGTLKESTSVNVQLKVQDAVWVEKHKNVIIPCSFNPGEDIVVHWRIANADGRIIHSYYQEADKLEKQDIMYKGRTSLFKHELAKGNASLQLREVQDSDENLYFCYVGTRPEKVEHVVKVHIADFNHSIKYIADNRDLPLKCYSSNYQFDIVTIKWYDNNKVIQEDLNTTSFCRSCPVNLSSHSYRCTIQHSIVESIWSGTWEMKTEESIVCECRSCNSASTGFSASLYLIQNTTDVLVASMNSSSTLNISEGYRNRVHRIPGELNFTLTNLTVRDNGDYICIEKTVNEMFISKISFNMTDSGEPSSGIWICVLVTVIVIVFILLTALIIWKRCSRNKITNSNRSDNSQTGTVVEFDCLTPLNDNRPQVS